MLKSCKKCKWGLLTITAPGPYFIYECKSPLNKAGIDLVTGEIIPIHEFCDKARADKTACGEDGVWYEER